MGGSSNSVEQGYGSGHQPDRRRLVRRKIKVKKIFAAKVGALEQDQNCFLHIHDLSEGGMRVHTDFEFPPDEMVPITLYLDEPINLKVRKVWGKELIGGMYVIGLEFDNPSEEDKDIINKFIDKYSPENRRRNFRLERILVVEMLLGTISQKFGVFTLDLSPTGMRIVHDFPLPEEVVVDFKILLEYDRPPIEVGAKVKWQKESALGQFQIGLEFVELKGDAKERLEQFIDANLEGALRESRQRFALLEDFTTSDLF